MILPFTSAVEGSIRQPVGLQFVSKQCRLEGILLPVEENEGRARTALRDDLRVSYSEVAVVHLGRRKNHWNGM